MIGKTVGDLAGIWEDGTFLGISGLKAQMEKRSGLALYPDQVIQEGDVIIFASSVTYPSVNTEDFHTPAAKIKNDPKVPLQIPPPFRRFSGFVLKT